MTLTTTREIHLAARPQGWPTAECFAMVDRPLPPLQDGQILVRNLLMSVDPYMRGRMNLGKSYVPQFEVGQCLVGGAIGEVVDARASGFAPGDLVVSMRGWCDAFVANASEVQRLERTAAPLSAHLGVLGGPGFTAWVGLRLVDLKAGDRVYISGAAGAVGSVAGQLAKRRGCFVVGSAGSADKVKILTEEFGFDAAFNYRDGDIAGQIAATSPDGIDVYFDNVGGAHLEAALTTLRNHGRIAACGAISTYNDAAPEPGPRNMFQVVAKRLTIRGFLVFDWMADRPAFLQEVSGLLSQGAIVSRETIVDGLEHAPGAFLDMMRGANVGKMIVNLA